MRVGRLAFWEGERFTHHVNERGEDEYEYKSPAGVNKTKKKAGKSPTKGSFLQRSLRIANANEYYYITFEFELQLLMKVLNYKLLSNN
jgi:hypothetical protein